jgi:hypothetical protein
VSGWLFIERPIAIVKRPIAIEKRPIAIVKVTEIVVREVLKNGSLCTFIDNQICTKTRRNLWFFQHYCHYLTSN